MQHDDPNAYEREWQIDLRSTIAVTRGAHERSGPPPSGARCDMEPGDTVLGWSATHVEVRDAAGAIRARPWHKPHA